MFIHVIMTSSSCSHGSFPMKKSQLVPLKQPKLLTKHQEIHVLVFFISCFTASVTPSITTTEFSNNCTILIISALSSFEMNKVNPCPAFTTPFPLLLSDLYIALEAAYLKLYCLLIKANYF